MSEILEKKLKQTRRPAKHRAEPPDPGANKDVLKQTSLDNRNRFYPSICYLKPAEMGELAHWSGHFVRASEMGFDSVLLASPFAAAEGLTLDYEMLDDCSGGGDALDALSKASLSARESGVKLMLDLDISRMALRAPLLKAFPDWFAHSADNAASEGAAFRFLAENDAMVDWWDERIASFQAAGIAGFRCLGAAAVLPSIWARLIEAAHARESGTRFMAWTPGSPAAAVSGLADAGFDYGFSSSCWWDFKSDWLNADAARVSRIGPAIALTNPLDQAFAGNAAARRRALHFAATYSAGWLMPMGFQLGSEAGEESPDLTEDVLALNKLRRQNAILRGRQSATLVSSAGSEIAILRRGPHGGDALAQTSIAIAVNSSDEAAASLDYKILMPCLDGGKLTILRMDGTGAPLPGLTLNLPPGEVTMLNMTEAAPIQSAAVPLGTSLPRIAIEAMAPKVDDGEFPVRRRLGESVLVTADIIADGHDKRAAELLWRPVDEKDFFSAPMALINNDRWGGEFPLQRLGRYVYAVAAWKDLYASFVDEVTKKHNAGVPTHLEIAEGLALIKSTAAAKGSKYARPLKALLKQLENAPEDTQRAVLLSDETVALMRAADPKKFLVRSEEVIVDAERVIAGFASWFEIFPRSQSGDPARHGNFADVIKRLPYFAEMGFDVLYFPPIHPIGRTNRKGRNNTLTPAPDDPGSPYAIGAEEGGHDAIHPELGTLAEFHQLRDAAAEYGMELALDFAIQCAPDHPWLKEHPEWFDWRPDGSLRYAENPPKKYEDIVNVDFYAEGATPSLWIALRDVVQFWVDQGVKLFRVDNPHTKPLPFWQWMIRDIQSRHPDVVFLAEAFTRPKLMYRLAKIGFSQSYTYFTWRNTKAELQEYLTELTTTAPKDFYRPHFFVNTPDINPAFLHHSGRAGFLIRAALAATLSGLWGVYNGFELCESAAIPGKEEYVNSEKYEIKAWDYERPGNIVPEITRLNSIRRSNAALQTHLGVEFLNAFNDQVLYFLKMAPDGNAILVAINLDPFNAQSADIEIPLWRFGLPDHAALAAEDLMRDHKFVWHGKMQSVWLNPYEIPFCIWRIQPST
jgi:starch synthase (maltosyl-transferring)